jgi:hypothetical protein
MLFNFYIDKDQEVSAAAHILFGCDMSSTIDRASQYGIPAGDAQSEDKLKEFLHDRHAMFAKELKQSLAYHKHFWNEKTCSEYREKFENILGHEMPDYNVRLDCQLQGISNWTDPNISISAFGYLRPFKYGEMVVELIWESMLSQTFVDVRKKWTIDAINDKNVWALSELAAVSIYQTDFCKSDWAIGYPELEPFRQTIKKIYAGRKNFADFLAQGVKFFQDNPIES